MRLAHHHRFDAPKERQTQVAFLDGHELICASPDFYCAMVACIIGARLCLCQTHGPPESDHQEIPIKIC